MEIGERARSLQERLVTAGRRCDLIRFMWSYLLFIFLGAAVAYDASSPRKARLDVESNHLVAVSTSLVVPFIILSGRQARHPL